MSNDRIATYIRSTLLPAGFAIIDGDLAHRLSVGLWPSVNNAAMDFRDTSAIINRFGGGCQVLRTEIEGREVLILARSMKGLKGRIEAVTGMAIGVITEHVAEEVKPVPVVKVADPNTSKLERELRKDYKRQAAEHADFERRKQSLAKGEQHRAWLEQRRIAAEASRQEFHAKRRAADG